MLIHNKSEFAKDVVKFIVLPEDNEYNFKDNESFAACVFLENL